MPPKKKPTKDESNDSKVVHGVINPNSMKVDELRIELGKRNLSTDGLKAVLVKRLELAIKDQCQPDETIETKNVTDSVMMTNDPVEDITESTESIPIIQQNFVNSNNIDNDSINSKKRKEMDSTIIPPKDQHINASADNAEDNIMNEASSVIVVANTNQVNNWSRKIKNSIPGDRTSSLAAPNILLNGHDGPVYSIAFDQSGRYLASASMDRQIFLWDIFSSSEESSCNNYNVLSGHKNAVLQIQWDQKDQLLSCSADHTLATWDTNIGIRTRKFDSHKAIVNSCSAIKDNGNVFASGSDDKIVFIWDARSKYPVSTIPHQFPVTAVCFSNDGSNLFTGGIDNTIRKFDLRNFSVDNYEFDIVESEVLYGHMDTITGLSISPDGNYLLSNSMDCTCRKWDIRPFTMALQNGRCEKIYEGAVNSAEKNLIRCSWSIDMEYITCGSANKIVHVWDSLTGKLLYYLGGHKGSVNQTIFHPYEPIIASCSSDKTIYLGELV